MKVKSKKIGTLEYLINILKVRTIFKYSIMSSIVLLTISIIRYSFLNRDKIVLFLMIIIIIFFLMSFAIDRLKILPKDDTDEGRYRLILKYYIEKKNRYFMLSESLAVLFKFMNPASFHENTPQYVKSNANRLYSIISNGKGWVDSGVLNKPSVFKELCEIFLDLLDRKEDESISYNSNIRELTEELNKIVKKKKIHLKITIVGEIISFLVLLIIVVIKLVVYLFEIDVSTNQYLDFAYNIGSDIFAFITFAIGMVISRRHK